MDGGKKIARKRNRRCKGMRFCCVLRETFVSLCFAVIRQQPAGGQRKKKRDQTTTRANIYKYLYNNNKRKDNVSEERKGKKKDRKIIIREINLTSQSLCVWRWRITAEIGDDKL